MEEERHAFGCSVSDLRCTLCTVVGRSCACPRLFGVSYGTSGMSIRRSDRFQLCGSLVVLSVACSLFLINLRGTSPPSTLTWARWEHGWPATFMVRDAIIVERGYHQFTCGWPPWDIHLGIRSTNTIAVGVNILTGVFILFCTAECLCHSSAKPSRRFQFSLRSLLLLPVFVAIINGMLIGMPQVLLVAVLFFVFVGVCCAGYTIFTYVAKLVRFLRRGPSYDV